MIRIKIRSRARVTVRAMARVVPRLSVVSMD